MRALLALSTSELELHGAESALRVAREALVLATDGSVPDLVGICHSQLAMILGRSGQPREALAQLDLAVSGGTGMQPRDRFVVLLSRGMVRMDLGDAEGAAGDFDAAAALAAEHDLVLQEFMARHNRGCAAQLAGDLPLALRLMIEADQLPVDISRAVAWLDRGRVLLDAGLVTEAAELLGRAADVGRDRDQHQVQGEIELELARALILLGDHPAALSRARRARTEFGRRGMPGWQRRAELVMLQARSQQQRPARSLAEDALRLAEELRQTDDRQFRRVALLTAAEASARTGEWDRAAELVRAVSSGVRAGGLEMRLRWRRVAAVTADHQGRRAAAARHLREAADDLHRSRAISSSLDLRAAATLHAGPLAELDIELRRSASSVLVALERWRSIATEPPLVRPPTDRALAAQVVELRRARAEARDHPGDPELRARIRALEAEVAAQFWAARGTTAAAGHEHAIGLRVRPREVVRRAVAELRERDTDLAALFRVRGRLGAVVVRGARSRLVELGPDAPVDEFARRLAADLSAAASVRSGPLAEVVRTSLSSTLQWCQEHVLGPLGLGDRALVVPCDGLTAVPWGMVPGRRGLPTTVTPSLSAWLDGIQHLPAPSVQAVCGPGLVSATDEAARVAATWGGGTAYPAPAAASAQDVRHALETNDLVHVAAHGTHHAESPVFSSLWMTDGPVFLCDLEGAAIRSSHVVISACEAGRSRRRAPVSHLGLASGLLTLGVGSVVASPCKVPDTTAAAVMTAYHHRLHAGQESAEALALAAAGVEDPLAGAFQALGGPWRAGG